MNILFHCSEYPPFKSGGIGSITKILAEELSSRGNNVYVSGFYPELSKGEYNEVINGVSVFRFSTGSRRTRFRRIAVNILNGFGLVHFLFQKELDYYEDSVRKLISEKGISVFEITDFYEFNRCSNPLRFKNFDIPVVLRAHGCASFLNKYRGISNPVTVHNDISHFSRASILSSVSRFTENYILSLVPEGLFKEKKVIYNSVEMSFIHHSEQSNNKVILYIGKLFDTKGADNTVLAFNRFIKNHPGWSLRMAGDGDIDRIMEMSDDKSSIHCLGRIDRTQIKHELDNCSFVCLPSKFESFSMTPLESMARNRAVIFTRKTSGPEVISDRENGILVDPDDIEQILESFTFLADNADERNRIAGKGFECVAERFNSTRMANICEDLYKKLSFEQS